MKNLAEVKGIVIAYGMGQIRNGKDVRSFDEPYGLGDPFPGDVFCYGYIQFLAENLFIAIPAAAASFGLSVLLADQVGAFLIGQTASDVEGLSVMILPEERVGSS